MGGDEQRGAGFVGLGEEHQQRFPPGPVETDERFVDEEQRERPDEGEGDCRLLPIVKVSRPRNWAPSSVATDT